MEKKYQVFVSSTYIDLLEERKEVTQVLLELDCIPVGMELFPAADEDQWSFIKSVIDDCDYYLLILAGRYGSLSETGISYTEMEYRHALETGKPIMSFLHGEPDNLSVSKTDQDSGLAKKLNDFRALAQKKLCKFWNTPSELGSIVGRSVVQVKKRTPAIGWVRADLVPDKDSTQEILRLKDEIEKLEFELENQQISLKVDITKLATGDSEFEVEFIASSGSFYTNVSNAFSKSYTWNTLFSVLSPALIDEESELELRNRINNFLLKDNIHEIYLKNGEEFKQPICDIDIHSFETIIIQFRALNLIEKSSTSRALNDVYTYWKLTSHGDNVMVGLRAIKSN